MQNSGALNPPKTREELTQYEQGWADMMVDIWHEQMSSLKTIDTGKLYASVRGSLRQGAQANEEIEHAFVLYGMNVNEGTGREMNDQIGKRQGDGTILVKDAAYREEHGLNKPRKRGPKWGGGYTSGHARQAKPWFDKKYIYSLYRLREVVQASYGEQYQSMTIEALNAIFAPAANDYVHKTAAKDWVG